MTKSEIKQVIDKISNMKDPQLLKLLITTEKQLGISKIPPKVINDKVAASEYIKSKNLITKDKKYSEYCLTKASPAEFALASYKQAKRTTKKPNNIITNIWFVMDRGFWKFSKLENNLQNIHPQYLNKLAELLNIKTKFFVPDISLPTYKSKSGKKVRAVEIHSDNFDQLNRLINSSMTPSTCDKPAWIGVAPDRVEDCQLFINHSNQTKPELIKFEEGNVLVQNGKGELSWMTKTAFEEEYGILKQKKNNKIH